MQTDFMYVTKSSEDGTFRQGQLNRYGNIQLSPSAGVLNYGQVNYLKFGQKFNTAKSFEK